jgi:glycosyltransferase involved in cell wall biosynthesis
VTTPNLRVVHVIDSLAGSGGAENRLVDEVVAMDDRFDQTVVRLFERDFLEARLTAAGIPVVALGYRAGRAGRTWPLVARRLAADLRDLRPDVIHTSLFTGNLVGQLAGWRLGVPVVSTFNRTGELALQRRLQPGVASWKGRAMQAVGRWATRRGDVHYRAVGEYARETNCASLGLPVDRATVVPRGVTLASGAGWVGADAAPGGRAPFGVPDGVPLFANVARLVPEKAQDLLVEAFARVRVQAPDARLAIAGAPGPADAAVLAAIERAGVGEVVHLLGFRDDARALVATADVFAFSSISEGSPGAVVEAMAAGAPVAAFAIPPVAELTEGDRYAWMAEPGSAASLAAAMLGALRDPDRHERAAAARAHAAERYSLPAVARQLGDLLERRAAGRTAGAAPPPRAAAIGSGAPAGTPAEAGPAARGSGASGTTPTESGSGAEEP